MRKVGIVFFALVMGSVVAFQAMAALTEAEIKSCVDSPEKLEAIMKGKDVAEVGAAVQTVIKAVAGSGASDRVASGRIAILTAIAIKLTGDKAISILPALVQAAGEYETSVVAATTVAAKKVCTDPKAVVGAAVGAAKDKAAAQEAAKTPVKVLGRLVTWKIERLVRATVPGIAVKATTTTTTTTTTQPKTPTPVGKL